MPDILVVDDEKSMREFLEIMLTREGYNVTLAENGENACEVLDRKKFNLIITDIRMKDIDGIGVLKKAKSVNPETVIVLISAFATAETAVEAMREGAYDYIPKPFKVREFKKIVKQAISSTKPADSGEEDYLNSRYHFGYLIGESPQMKKVYGLIRRVAETKTNILISADSGTGKELVARAIHHSSERREKPFVIINCAGIPENLIESELFGYKKGAFTGATQDKEGLFDVADGGTVFLDEVGELSPSIQVKLLRVIQERTFTAVGGTDEKNVDVRFISATNKDLEKEVINKNFREDLYFRLNVINIALPLLRERDGDLPLLAQNFLEKYSREMGKEIRKVSAYAMDILGQYSFPGNVRELENIIERSVALETSNIVLPESLTLSNFRQGSDKGSRRRSDLGPEGIELDGVMADIERDYILKAMELAYGSRQRAAELLGISMRSLRYRLDKLGL
ncbi:MAG: sigma-54-dependent Fis family transcriptional regulator [Deltaproteobacteria bacterium]|nr:sigma-54-dependent Fis family transcriptional regulator [Deltaproteobacteria bacterium]MBW2119004.1 sigma-54-dependent Fis family transcriptional regulator [Deltaproteobacteria bacterium]MBW2344146.1 sigma-54-dependent Fis family transcriptional regulator [Deltaproteobacteria bacterium]